MNIATDTRPAFAPDFTGRQVLSLNDPLMQSIYRLRYEVYTQECGFLPAADYPDQLESDAFDASSAHFCAFNKGQEMVGYVRLVSPDALSKLPFESHCAQWLPGALTPPLPHSGEISRLMVRKDYRRRRGDLLSGVTDPDAADTIPDERRNPSPQIMLTLFKGLYEYSVRADVRYLFAAMERPLIRAMAFMGFTFQAVGGRTDYYGEVTPCVLDLRELEDRAGRSNPALLRWLQAPPVAAA